MASLVLVKVFVLAVVPWTMADLEQKRKVGYLTPDICYQKIRGECQPLEPNASCFGVALPYSMFSSELVHENFTENQLKSDLKKWEGLRNAPRCWAVIQPLLCSYYFPKCSNGSIELPTNEMCKIAQRCRGVIEKATHKFPDFLNCNNTLRFPVADCKPAIREQTPHFNMSGTCLDPMIEVENSFNHYEGFEGCALKCKDPHYDEEDHTQASTLIWYMGVVTLMCNAWVVLTYVIEGMASSRYPQYPSAIVLYANVWYCIATIGWLFQYLPLGKEDIVCRKDGTVRRNELTGTENIFCGMVSSWIYFSMMSVLAWMVVFSYVSDLTCKGVGRIRHEVDKQRAYFIVWALAFPMILTVVSLSVAKIDGSSVYGICFIGFYEKSPRVFLVMVPIGVTSCIVIFYLLRGACRLWSVSLDPSDFVAKGREQLKSVAFRFLLFSLMSGCVLIYGLILQVNSMSWQPVFERSLREWLLCRMNLNDGPECTVPEKPNVSTVLGNIAVFFSGGILVSSWAWTSSSMSIWRRSLKTLCKSDETEEHRPHMPKHKLIAKAFAKRNELSAKGRLSLSMYSTHEDPVGLNKLLDPTRLGQNPDDVEQSQQLSQGTVDGQEISSEWAMGLTRFVQRRGALVPPHSSNSCSYVSEDSRRPSVDSATSEQLAAKYLQGSHLGLDHRNTSRRERFRMSRKRAKQLFNFRRRNYNKGSSTSLESNPGSQILPAITKLIDKREQMGDENLFVPNNQVQRAPQTKIVRELAIQTSIEKLYSPPRGTKQCNLSNNLCVDKATQSSLVNLNEIGTQTKKSATKRKDKHKEKKDEESKATKDQSPPGDAAAIKLLTPNPN